MIDRKLGKSGYQISDFSPEDGGVWRVTFHIESIYVTLMLGPEEMYRLVEDLQRARHQ